MRSLGFSIYLILPAALWFLGLGNEFQESSLEGGRGGVAGVYIKSQTYSVQQDAAI
jgi:hypothetical protein